MTKPEVTPPSSASVSAAPSVPWWKLLNRYHWFVLLVASAAWFFDCLDQRLFSLARTPALLALMKGGDVQNYGKVVTAWFLIGWGVGGMIFGALGDRYGRARMLTVTILTYSAFTGLSFFSRTPLDFTIFRFLTGLGVGGVFGLAVALIAETVPSGARAQSLGLLQVLSTIGNVTAGFTKMGIDALEANRTVTPGEGWRWMFLIGAVPAVMVILTSKYLKEPETWQRLKAEGRLPKGGIFAPYAGLFGAARWRKNLIVGAMIASTGVIGLWAIGEYAVDLQTFVFRRHFEKQAPVTVVESFRAAEQAVKAAGPNATDAQKLALATARKDYTPAVVQPMERARTYAYLLNMLGAATGMWMFTRFANATGRKPAFAIGFTVAMLVTAFVYWKMDSPQDAYWMMFLMGAAQLGVFAGFAIYLPELFPSRLRSTGTSFCYNLGRFAAAGGSFFSSLLSQNVFGHFDKPLPYRYSAITMCVIFLMGLVALLFAPETKGEPLPED